MFSQVRITLTFVPFAAFCSTLPSQAEVRYRLTPAMQAGITRELWTMDRLYDEVMA